MAEQSATGSGWPGIVSIWAGALVGAALVAGLAYSGQVAWFGEPGPLGVYAALGVVLAATVLGTLVVQLASRRPEGFVDRVSRSIAGAVVVVALGAAIVAPVALR